MNELAEQVNKWIKHKLSFESLFSCSVSVEVDEHHRGKERLLNDVTLKQSPLEAIGTNKQFLHHSTPVEGNKTQG